MKRIVRSSVILVVVIAILAISCSSKSKSERMNFGEFTEALGQGQDVGREWITLSMQDLVQRVGEPHRTIKKNGAVFLEYETKGAVVTVRTNCAKWPPPAPFRARVAHATFSTLEYE